MVNNALTGFPGRGFGRQDRKNAKTCFRLFRERKEKIEKRVGEASPPTPGEDNRGAIG